MNASAGRRPETAAARPVCKSSRRARTLAAERSPAPGPPRRSWRAASHAATSRRVASPSMARPRRRLKVFASSSASVRSHSGNVATTPSGTPRCAESRAPPGASHSVSLWLHVLSTIISRGGSCDADQAVALRCSNRSQGDRARGRARDQPGSRRDPGPSGGAPVRGPAGTPTLHRTIRIDGLDIFYREAGPKDAPTVLLLHGFPTSSHMFRNLIPALADEFHVVAPDYPGFGYSSMPRRWTSSSTPSTSLADVVEKFTEKVGLTKYALYVQDYGAPVGYRLAVKHPERVTALVVQNGNAYDEGIDNDFWKPIKAYWKDRQPEKTPSRCGSSSRPKRPSGSTPTASGTPRRSARTPGPSTSTSSTDRATPTSNWPCSTATAATRRCTRGGRSTSASTSRRRSSCGGRTIESSRPPVPSRTSGT